MPSANEIEQINRAATFLPQDKPYTRPCLTVGGAQVYAYVNHAGRLVVAVNLDTVDEAISVPVITDRKETDRVVPVSIWIGDTAVFETD